MNVGGKETHRSSSSWTPAWKKAKRKNQTQEEQMAEKIAVEERKLLIAQRKLESIRLLDELLDRVKVINLKVKKRCLKRVCAILGISTRPDLAQFWP